MKNRIRSVVLGLGLLVASAVSVSAQSTAYVVFNDTSGCSNGELVDSCKVSKLLKATVDGAASRVDWVRLVPKMWDNRQMYVTPDAGSVVWLGVSLETGPGVYVHDVASGRTTIVGPFHTAHTLIGNPDRPEVYVFDFTGVIALSPAGARRLDGLCHAPNNTSPSIGGGRLAYACVGEYPATAVFDIQTGARVATYQGTEAKLSADGTELFTYRFENDVFMLQRRSVATGHLITEAASPSGQMIVDPATGDLLLYDWSGSRVHLVDGTTLATKRSTSVRFGDFSVRQAAINTASGLLVTAGDAGAVDVFDTRSLEHVVQARIRNHWWLSVAVGSPVPAAPTAATAQVTGSAVQVSWTPGGPPAAVSRYVLEAGSASGLSDVLSGLDVGALPSFAASSVPSGTYYVRVRAGNYAGLGAPSNEIVVTVP